MDNGMEHMLDMYLFESNTLMEQLDGILLNAEKAENFTAEDIDEIFRIMHTIKGSSAMMQFTPISNVAHRMEDLFYCIRQHGISTSHRLTLFDVMFKSSDFLKSQIDKIQNSEPLADNIDDIVAEISDLLATIDPNSPNPAVKEPAGEPNAAQLADEGESGVYSLRVFFDEGCGMENLRAFMLANSIREACEDFTYQPENVETDASTCGQIIEEGFLLHFNSKKDLDAAVTILQVSLNIKTYEQIIPEPRAVEAVPEPGSSDPSPTQAGPAAVKKTLDQSPAAQHTAKQSLISVNLTKLDMLMNIVGEIVITEAMVTASPDLRGLKLDNFTKSARQLRKLTDELQSIVMSIRMVPVAGVFQRMNRIVRDIGQTLQKDVKLTIIGEDTEVDKTIVDSISDPIMHMVRNSMDHGIEETAEARIKVGKSPQAEITLKAEHTGSEVVITISDDGRGVNTDRVLQKAAENGLLTKPESEYTKKEILQLLLLPGFSTKAEVTEYSGRGVGMDVVKKNIEKVGGTVLMTSEAGQGTTTTFKIPLTLAIMDGMEISVGSSIFTVPITNIRQSFKVSKEDVVHDSDGGEMIWQTGSYYPIIRLHELYGLEGAKTEIEDGILIWVESSERSFFLFVDELLGEHQVVIKSPPPYINNFGVKDIGITGFAILGDGNISIILDVANIHEAFRRG